MRLAVASALLAGLAPNAPAEWVWQRLDKISPPSVSMHSMAYDSARNRVVMAAGRRYFTESNGHISQENVWEWDGEDWHEIVGSAHPERVHGGAMAYDSKRQRTVFFGGTSGVGGETQRTFEWDGAGWTEFKGQTAPPPRTRHQMAYDEKRGVCVMFGGYGNGHAPGDTWEYNGTEWRLVSTTGPTPRNDAAMAYDPVRERVFLHGGSSVSFPRHALADLWEWDGKAWTAVQSSNRTPALIGHSMAIVPNFGLLLTHGKPSDNTSEISDRTWRFDGTGWQVLNKTPFQGRAGHATLYHPALGRTILFGGDGRNRRYSDLWLFDGKDWSMDDLGPLAFRSVGLIYDEARGNYVLFGGIVEGYHYYLGHVVAGDTWVFEGKWRKLNPKNSPTPKVGAMLIYDQVAKEVILFSGDGRSNSRADEMWAWNGVDWRRIEVTGRIPSGWGRVWFDEALQRIAMIDGWIIPRIWTWDGVSWQQKRMQIPIGLSFAAYDRSRNLALFRQVFGGRTWVFDGTDFTHVATETGDQLFAPVMAFDNRVGLGLLYGGQFEFGGSTASGKTWTGSQWLQLGPQPPGRRSLAAYASSPDGHTLIYGGEANGYDISGIEYYDDTWSVEWKE